MDLATAYIAALGTVAAIAAVSMAYFAWRTSEQVAAVQLFLELRQYHAQVQSRMDSRYHDPSWEPSSDAAAMKTLEQYWLHTFTEWYATTRLNKGKFNYIWRDFFEKAVVGGLRNAPLRKALCQMDSTFSGHRKQFLEEISSLCYSAYNERLSFGEPNQASPQTAGSSTA
jgi:hypothetical protein